MAFTIKGGKFSTTDDDKTIRQSPVDEVIDILTAPSRPAPVNVGMMPERRGNVNIPMGQSTFVNVPGRPDEKQVQTPLKVVSPFKRNPVGSVDDVLFNLSLADAAGQPINYGGGEGQLSGSFTNYPGGEGYQELVRGDKVDPISTAPYTGIEQILARQAQAGQGDAYKDFFFEEGLREPSIFDSLQSLAQKALGYPEGMRGLYQMEQDKQVAMARDQELGDERRKDQERAERAAMLAAQQQQPVDPCPEGYRMDPVSRVCVPTDDTTEPVETTKRTYETMTEPVADYTAKTDFTVPTVTLPDILTYG
jgi:hypothetical protein